MQHLRNQAGSVLVFITLMIVVLMVMVGMGLDTGFLTFSRSMGQRAVDLAALAGAAGLAKLDVAAIKSNIEQLNATNENILAEIDRAVITEHQIDSSLGRQLSQLARCSSTAFTSSLG